MNSKDFIKWAMRVKSVTQQELANKLGYSGQQGISALVNNNKSMTVDTFVALLTALGYELTAIDKENRTTTQITDKKGKIKPRNIKGRPPVGKDDPKSEPKEEIKKPPVFQYGK